MRIEIGQIVTQIISFLIMLWVLKRYAWKPLLSTLDERRKKIKSDIDTIEQQKQEVESLKKQYQEKLNDIDHYARNKIHEAVQEGRKKADEILQATQKKAQALILQAQDDLKKEIFKAKVQLKNELVNMTIMAAEKILRTKLDKENQMNIMKDFIEQIGSQ